MTSVSAGHIILTPTQPVGSGRPQWELNLGPPHQESRALPTELPREINVSYIFSLKGHIFVCVVVLVNVCSEFNHLDYHYLLTLDLEKKVSTSVFFQCVTNRCLEGDKTVENRGRSLLPFDFLCPQRSLVLPSMKFDTTKRKLIFSLA